jgi:acylphosphatase
MKLRTKITGSKVHEIGYRVFLLRKALELGVDRFNAYNTKENGNQVLIAFLEGDENQNATFKEFARSNKPENAEVADVTFEDYEGYVISIADYMHLIQVEQLSKGIPAILSIDRKQDRMLEKQDGMLGKQDKTISVIKEESGKTRTELISVIREEGEKTRTTIKSCFAEEIHQLRDEILEIRHEIAEIKEKVGA